jgi:hypothetical protein
MIDSTPFPPISFFVPFILDAYEILPQSETHDVDNLLINNSYLTPLISLTLHFLMI